MDMDIDIKFHIHGNPGYIETLSLKRTLFEIFDFKNAVTLKTGLGVRQGHWKCQHSIERVLLPIDVL